MKKLFMLQATAGLEQRARPNQYRKLHKTARLPAGEHDVTRHIFKPLKNPGERRGNVIRFIRQSNKQPLPNFGSRHTSLLFTNIRCETVTSIYVREILLYSLLL